MFDEKNAYNVLLITRSKKKDKFTYKLLGYHTGGGQLKIMQFKSDEISFISMNELGSFYQSTGTDYKYYLFILQDCEIVTQKKFDNKAQEIIDQSTEGFIFEDEAEDIMYLLNDGFDSYDEIDY